MIELSVVLPPLLGGVIGYLTNDIAIRMLFRPHKAKYVFGVHVPFTPGIIPKEKNRIAETIGTSISENLINKEVLAKYLLSDDMVAKVKCSVDGFIEKQKGNEESVRTFLCHYLSEDEVKTIACNINEDIAQGVYTKLTDPVVGEKVAMYAMNSVAKSLTDDGPRTLFAGINGLAKGIGGFAASLFGIDVIGKFLSLLREPAEKYLANTINTMLQQSGQQIVTDMLGRETDNLLDKPVAVLLKEHEGQLAQLSDYVESVYKTVIKEHLPRILESVDISEIVSERIKEMNMDEIEPLILEVMDKELKAIVWFGAGLGALIGCINIFV